MAEADKEKKKWLVSDKHCKGCMYYSRLGHQSGAKCCDYTYLTGRFRENPPAKCEVKKRGKRPILINNTNFLAPKARKARKGGAKRG